MNRREFAKQTKRDALKRSGGKCEAIGGMYGLALGRCNAPLAYGVEFDHVILDANSKDNSLENCAAVCIKCHKWKTAKHDTPLAAKTVRQQDKNDGIEKPRGFRKPPPGYDPWRRRMKAEGPLAGPPSAASPPKSPNEIRREASEILGALNAGHFERAKELVRSLLRKGEESEVLRADDGPSGSPASDRSAQ